MRVDIDLRIAELLASRLCHDLVGPIGAVSNGLELLEEDGGGTDGEAMSLATGSAKRALNALSFYRTAHGRAGDQLDGRAHQVRSLADAFLRDHKARLVWHGDALRETDLAGAAKLTLNTIALASETLPRGGDVTVAVTAGPPFELTVTADGHGAGLGQELRAAIATDADVETLTPRGVQAHFAALLAHRAGLALAPSEMEGRCTLTAAPR